MKGQDGQGREGRERRDGQEGREGREGQGGPVERLLRHSPQLNASAATLEACLEADVLAAWADGSLQPHELRLAEAHAATCARCRAVMAAIIRTEPVADLGAAAVPWWRLGWNLGWLVPLTAGAAALALWVALPSPSGPPTAPAEVSQRAAGRVDPSSPAPAAPDQERQVVELRREVNQADQLQDRPAPAGAAPAAAPPPARSTASDARAAAPVASLAEAVSPAVIDIPSPDARIRWRIVPTQGVERTTDAGVTWTAHVNRAGLTAGASPGPSICWVVGPDGVVLLTVDGQTWQERTLAERTNLAAVQAEDGERATVIAADGRRFATTDGGSTWTPLQGF